MGVGSAACPSQSKLEKPKQTESCRVHIAAATINIQMPASNESCTDTFLLWCTNVLNDVSVCIFNGVASGSTQSTVEVMYS